MDFIFFDEGKTDFQNNGLPSTCTFDLSTKTVDELGASATYAGGFAKVTGTGYAAKTQAEPTSVKGKVEFSKMTWETGAATDWPSSVKSIVLRNGEKLLSAWNLQAGGAGRDMSKANTAETWGGTQTLS